MNVVYSYLVGFSPGRPITPDAAHHVVHVLEADSTAGRIRAGVTAALMVTGSTGCAMPTSTQLIAVEL